MRTKRFVLITSVVLLFALMLTAPVFADGEAPPEEPAPTEEAPAEAPSEDPPVEAPTEAAPEEPEGEAAEVEADEPAGDQAPEEAAEEPPAEEVEAAEKSAPPAEDSVEPAEVAVEEIEATDEDTVVTDEEMLFETEAPADVVLVDASGATLDMASQESADLLEAPDPYFKVGSTTYRFFASPGVCAASYPGDPNCHDGEGSDVIQDALQYMTDNSVLPSNRMLYVEGGIYDGFTIDGTSSSQMAQLNGVIGEDGSQNTWIDGDINVWSNTGGFTLQGFTIDHINGLSLIHI